MVYLYVLPRIAVLAPTSTLRLAAARKTVLAASGASLGAAYPNPAQTEVTITCQLAQAGQYAYQLVVEGRLVAAPQKLIVHP